MSIEYSNVTLNMNHPRSIWANILQLTYTIIAMIPVYYYLREIVGIENDALYVMLSLPIASALVLYFVGILMNEYYWYEEKIRKNRDIVLISIKSTLFVVFYFYLFYLFMFSYWFSQSDIYNGLVAIENPVGREVTHATVSVGLVLFIVLLRRGIQDTK